MNKALMGLAAGAALTLSAGTALADGYGSTKDVPMVAPQASWSGLYVGAAVGYGIGSTDLHARDEEFVWAPPPGGWVLENVFSANLDGISSEGFQGILTLGYDQHIHPWLIVGVFGEYAFGDLETEASINLDNDFGGRLVAEITDSWAIGARLGLVPSCCTMWYLAAGYARADLDWKASAFEDGGHFPIASGGKSLSGWFIGGGVEHQLRENLFLKLDYRYTSYDTERLASYEEDEGDGMYRGHLDSQTDVHSVRLGVNWKVDLFGARHGAPAYGALK